MTVRAGLMRCILMSALLCGACAGVRLEHHADSLLSQADTKLVDGDYSGAISLYGEFAAAKHDHAQAPRARATQAVLERMLAVQSEITRAQNSGEAARRELTERQAEADRLKAEVAKLRTDLERLRNIDLQPRPR